MSIWDVYKRALAMLVAERSQTFWVVVSGIALGRYITQGVAASDFVCDPLARLQQGTRGLWTGGLGIAARRRKTGLNAHRPSPFVEDVENVRLAEVDLHRTAPRPFAIVALEAAIDAGARDFERHSSRRPAGDEIERRTGDTNEMPVVLAAEVSFNLPTEIGDRGSPIVGRYWFLSHTSLRP